MEFIKNFRSLKSDSNKVRTDILEILDKTMTDIKIENRIKESVRYENGVLDFGEKKIDLNQISNIYVVGAGKATYILADALYKIIGDKIKEGVIVVKKAPEKEIGSIRVIEGGHPIPNENGLGGAEEIIKLSERAEKNDLIISLISGGGSALLASPLDNIRLEDLKSTNEVLLASGAIINEINVLRKHISRVKGGKLSRLAYPATLISLIVSDVVGDELSSIASGPTTGDSSTYKDAIEIIEKYNLSDKLPESVIDVIQKGKGGKVKGTVKPGSRELSTTTNIIILNNLYALKSVEKHALKKGYNAIVLSSRIEGEARECGIFHSGLAEEIRNTSIPIEPPAIVISGGETTVTMKEFGKTEGGPNQECVCGFMSKIEDGKNLAFLSIDSDGIDGNSEFAGAIFGGKKVKISKNQINEALEEHKTSELFRKINCGIKTGETGNNVNDIRILGIV